MISVNLRRDIEQFFNQNRDLLQENYPGLTINRIFQELSNLTFFGSRNFQETLSQISCCHQLGDYFLKLKEGVPLAYIFNLVHFYGHTFSILPGVFIPRYETEILVEMAQGEMRRIEKLNKETPETLKVCDLGTGTGIILLSSLIGRETPWKAYGFDLNELALMVAKKNAFFLKYLIHPVTEITFQKNDLLEGVQEKMHLILTNPPYIKRSSDWETVHWAVKKYEPPLALFLDDEKYLSWFKILFERAFNLLYNGGVLLMEGHENHLEELKALAESLSFIHVECKKDLTGRLRFLRAVRP